MILREGGRKMARRVEAADLEAAVMAGQGPGWRARGRKALWALLICGSWPVWAEEVPEAKAGPGAWGCGRWVDLTHPFDADTIYWPTAEGFRLSVDFKGEAAGGYHYEANSFAAAEHGGTHLDAPAHFAAGRHTTEQIPLERLMAPAAVVDVSAAALANRDYLVQIADLEAWEKTHGRIPDGWMVLLHTGYDRFWPDREKYMGTAERGAQAVPKLHFPGLDPAAATWLVKNRAIAAIGLDTPSIDYGQSTTFQSHRILFEANIPAFENVDNLGELPSKGALIAALPMKIATGSGGPLRIVACVQP